MRATFQIILEFSLDRSQPVFFDSLAQYDTYPKLDRGAFLARAELIRVECEIPEGEEGHARQALEIYGRCRADVVMPGWSDFGRIIVERVENKPLPEFIHGMEGAHPGVRCPACSKAMVARQGKNGRLFYGCQDYPSCAGTRSVSV